MEKTPLTEIPCVYFFELAIIEKLTQIGVMNVADLQACDFQILHALFAGNKNVLLRIRRVVDCIALYNGAIGTQYDADIIRRVFAGDTHLYLVLYRKFVPLSFLLNARTPDDYLVIDQIGPILAEKIWDKKQEIIKLIGSESQKGQRAFLGM